MITTLHLHGDLARFGGPFRLHVASPAEAVRLLSAQLPGFRARLREGAFRVVAGELDERNDLDAGQLRLPLASRDLHLVPAVAGAGRNGVGKIIVGVVIIAAAIVTAGAALGAAGAAAGAGAGAGAGAAGAGAAAATGLGATAFTVLGSSITFGQIALFGASLVLTGVSQLLAPQPKAPGQAQQADPRASFIFSGPINTSSEDAPVPLAYGRIRAGSVIVSAGIHPEQLPASSDSPMNFVNRGGVLGRIIASVS